MTDTFLAWSTKYFDGEKLPYYVRLDQMNRDYPNDSIWFLDYGRFKTFEEAQAYIETLPEPEEAYKQEMKVFDDIR